MEIYITLFNSIKGTYHTFPFNQEEIDAVKETCLFKQGNPQELVYDTYKGLIEDNEVLTYTASLSYLLKSQTFKLGGEMGMNCYYIYVSSGDGLGFCRMCGGIAVQNITEAVQAADGMVSMVMKKFQV